MWVGMGNPCDEDDMDLFYASTTITIGNGAIAPFWDSPWLFGRKPKDVAPLIFECSTRKNWKVREALLEGAWIGKVKISTSFTLEHIRQFVHLWTLLRNVHLEEDRVDSVAWKHTTNGEYTTASAYRAQFLDIARTEMNKTIWKVWAPPKIKFFAWLALQNRL